MREFARIWKPMPKIVFSTSLNRVAHSARLVQGDVGSMLEELRQEFAGNIDVGGPNPRRPVRPSRARGRVSAGRASGGAWCGQASGRTSTRRSPFGTSKPAPFASDAELRSYVPA
jgi:hypothetical protein